MRTEETIVATCPEDEILAGFVDAQLTDVDRARIESHLAGCVTCLDVVTATLPAGRRPADVEPVALAPVVAALRPPRRRSGGWRRFAIAAGVVAVTGAALVGAYRRPITDRAGPWLTQLGTRMLGVPLHAGAASVGVGGGGLVVRLQDVTIGKDAGRLVRLDELAMNVALSAPLTSDPVLSRVRLVRPVVDLRGGPGGFGLPRIDRRPLAALFATAGAFDVVDAHLVLPLSPVESLEIDALNGGAERVPGGARMFLHGKFAEGEIDVAGTLTDDGDRLTLTIGGRGLAAQALPISNGRLVGTADLRLDIAESGATRRVNGRLAIHDGRVLGVRGVDLVQLNDAAREAVTTLHPDLALDNMPFDDARAIFGVRDGVWRLPRIFVGSNGFLVGGRARIAAIGEVAGRGTVRVPADLVEALLPFEPALESFRDQVGTATLPFAISGPILKPHLTLRQH